MGCLPQDEDVFNERMRIYEQDNAGAQNEAVVLKGLTKVRCLSTPWSTDMKVLTWQHLSLWGRVFLIELEFGSVDFDTFGLQ